MALRPLLNRRLGYASRLAEVPGERDGDGRETGRPIDLPACAELSRALQLAASRNDVGERGLERLTAPVMLAVR